jgi:integrase
MRRGELAAVHSDDVRDLVTGPTLRVEGKGGVTRWVPLPDDLAAWIRMQRGYAFPSPSGHMTPSGVGKWYRRRLGVKVHSLRHRYATRAYQSGHDINAVSRLLGHAKTETTQGYVAMSDEDLLASARGAWTEAA